ncbi:MAG: Na(+)-translocating NADH-quinone reductase subunit C [Desulfuromonadaceae bacterium]|nr:Na(+)-translocating NADH-quinone reductase subunit C [Desulfuromonadaceae bacterium]MDD2855207.1 Na(+)-translocating NADH-quinone reductase subunit C [Desulfuromonadaceae bacterium]
MPRDSTKKILTVALLVCVVCSVLVSVAAIGLKKRQQQNQEEEKRKNILQIAGLYDPAKSVDQQFQKVRAAVVDLESGLFDQSIDPLKFDSRRAAAAAETSLIIPPEKDKAGIKVRSRFMDVYLVEEQSRLKQVVLPVYGKGLWSTMYGFIALGDDLSTVTGFGFYQHGETPGLGGEIENRNWLAEWQGKKVYDHSGAVRLSVGKGVVDLSSPDAVYLIDGLSGATLTSRGVSNLILYWLGENGYKPFLDHLRKSSEKI